MSCLLKLLEGLRTGLPVPGKPLPTSFKPDDFYYHSTIAANLPGIAKHGLKGSMEGGPAFMSERTAVARWYEWVALEAYHLRYNGQENPDPKEQVPVVLRFPKVIDAEIDYYGSTDTEVMIGWSAHRYDPDRYPWPVYPESPPWKEATQDPKAWPRHKMGEKRYKDEMEKYARAYFTKKGVPAKLIKVYDGYRWLPISQYKKIDLTKALRKGGGMKPVQRNPLVPTL